MKRMISILLCLTMLLSLCACGSHDENKVDPTTGPTQQNVPATNQPGLKDNTDSGHSPAQPRAQKYTLSEYLATGETIWFLLDSNKGKDSEVREIIVMEPNGTMYRAGGGYSLGEVEQMEDAEIVEMVKQEFINDVTIGNSHSVFFKQSKEGAIANICYRIQSIAEPDLDYYTGEVTPTTIDTIIDFINANSHNLGSVYLTEEIVAYADQILLITQPIDALASKMGQHSEFKEKDGLFKGIHFETSYFNALASYYVTCEEIPENDGLHNVIRYIESVGFEEDLKAIETAVAGLYDMAEEIYNNTVKRIEDSKALVQPGQYRLSIVSDSTGNNTLSMKLHYQYVYDIASMEARTISYTLDVQIPVDVGGNICGTVVYDSVFGGYSLKGYSGSSDAFYTRAVEGMELNLDQIGECDLPVDVKDAEALFN